MSVVHEYTLIIQWSEEDQLYLAYSPELPGCITHGRTYVEAAEMGVEVMELWCDAACAAGEALPAPLQYQGEGPRSLREVAGRMAADLVHAEFPAAQQRMRSDAVAESMV